MQILIVGAGLSGSVLARQCAERIADCQQITVIDKRNHIGGNCFDEIDAETGIRTSLYGAHIFHTNNQQVVEFLSRFTDWEAYEHRVLAKLGDDKYVPVPVNIDTVNEVFGLEIRTKEEMEDWLRANQIIPESGVPKNGEEAAKARVGQKLYDLLFKNYTKKQWDKYPEELDASVLQRIPVRYDFEDRYFTDKFQALPKDGYTALFQRMLDHPKIKLELDCDYFMLDRDYLQSFNAIFYTGPIDRFFQDHGLPALEYRSIQFKLERLDASEYQPSSVINYPLMDTPYTRTVEYKHFPNQPFDKGIRGTVIVHETTCDDGEPFYPVPNDRNRLLYQQYQKLAEEKSNRRDEDGQRSPIVRFVGRLASYKYLNMDQAVEHALAEFELFIKTF
jgi:UDP-galactopyranose mutase